MSANTADPVTAHGQCPTTAETLDREPGAADTAPRDTDPSEKDQTGGGEHGAATTPATPAEANALGGASGKAGPSPAASLVMEQIGRGEACAGQDGLRRRLFVLVRARVHQLLRGRMAWCLFTVVSRCRFRSVFERCDESRGAHAVCDTRWDVPS